MSEPAQKRARDEPVVEDAEPAMTEERMKCPYLDTIQRAVIDFDFEKLCSISLSNLNVYCCLCCGKFFQGRGRNTHAFTHSVQMSHHVFINLGSCRIYCLPDNYEGKTATFFRALPAPHYNPPLPSPASGRLFSG